MSALERWRERCLERAPRRLPNPDGAARGIHRALDMALGAHWLTAIGVDCLLARELFIEENRTHMKNSPTLAEVEGLRLALQWLREEAERGE